MSCPTNGSVATLKASAANGSESDALRTTGSSVFALSMFSQNLEEGINAAHELEELNSNRKETTKNITKKIYKILDARITSENKLPEIVVVGATDWNPGILGILASKILEKYNVNVFVFGQDESNPKQFKGSCRSKGDIHLVKLMSKVADSFLHFGGHELAGGFSIEFEKLHILEKILNENIEHGRIPNLVEEKKENHKNNFIKINLHEVTSQLLDALGLIGPFGVGNPKPVFKISNIQQTVAERFGKSREHLKLRLTCDKIKIEAIKFFVEKEEEEKILELHKNDLLFFEIEPGWNSPTPRLKIVY
jgi:single-stranded-DNA-specific exonuclease